jgi:oligopeptide transport system ATP-binding protein
LEEVGITDAEKRMKQYPHQLSGGMRQRVVIAIALACNPELLICDEPTTALDVTIQAKILELIKKIQKERGISVIYITHDLGVVAKVADYVDVMYAGKIVEKGTIDEIFYDPKHPYTWGLLSAMPDLDTNDDRLYTIPGSPPNLLHETAGDAFAPRNIYALKIDDRAEPPMFKISETHYAATWLLDPRAPKIEMPAELKGRIERMIKEAGR